MIICGIDDIKFNRIHTIGDGSCFLHSILQSFNKKYNEGTIREKMDFVKKIRFYLAECLTENNNEIYNSLSRNEIEEIAKFVPDLKIENMQRYLKSRNWLNIFFLELISNIFDIDIYIIDSHTKDLYRTGDKEIYYKKRDSIIIYYIRDTHFESMSVNTEDGEFTLFSHDSYVIQKLYNKL